MYQMFDTSDGKNWLIKLEDITPLYNTPGASKVKSIQELYQASRDIQAIMDVKYVMCNHILSRSLDELDFTELQLEMGTEDGIQQDEHVVQCVVVPASWTPCIYLRLLQLSVEQNKLLSVQCIEYMNKQCKLMNDIHNYFHLTPKNDLNLFLLARSSFYSSTC